jgi:ribosome-binding factor A
METTRQQKISRLIQEDMSEIFLKEMKPVLGNSLITVTNARITPDLSIVRLYVSLMPIGELPATPSREAAKATQENLLTAIKEMTPDLRRRLGLREAKQLRIIPHLEFFLDDSLDYAERINELLKK